MASKIKIADLRQRIKFQTQVRAADGQGGFTQSWTDFAEVWAKVEPYESRESYYTDQIRPTISHRIWIRKLDGVLPSMRIVFGSRLFSIHGSIKLVEENWFMEIKAEENVAS